MDILSAEIVSSKVYCNWHIKICITLCTFLGPWYRLQSAWSLFVHASATTGSHRSGSRKNHSERHAGFPRIWPENAQGSGVGCVHSVRVCYEGTGQHARGQCHPGCNAFAAFKLKFACVNERFEYISNRKRLLLLSTRSARFCRRRSPTSVPTSSTRTALQCSFWLKMNSVPTKSAKLSACVPTTRKVTVRLHYLTRLLHVHVHAVPSFLGNFRIDRSGWQYMWYGNFAFQFLRWRATRDVSSAKLSCSTSTRSSARMPLRQKSKTFWIKSAASFLSLTNHR